MESIFGVMRWLEEREIGFGTNIGKVPIVVGGVVFDLSVGSPITRPTKEWGYQACELASLTEMRQGNVGAGTGVTVGKVRGMESAVKGGTGVHFVTIGGTVHVAALAVVNAWGDVVDFRTGQIVAGARDPQTGKWLHTEQLLLSGELGWGFQPMLIGENTTLVCVVTDAYLTKVQATKAAQWAQNGLALAVRPAHTMYDGDLAVVASVGNQSCDFHALCVAIQHAVTHAILNAVKHAQPLHGIPAASEFQSG